MGKPIFSNNYIVRIYRWGKNKPGSLVGVVEEVGVKGKNGFTNYNELWEILNSPNCSISTSRTERSKVKGKGFYGGKSDKE